MIATESTKVCLNQPALNDDDMCALAGIVDILEHTIHLEQAIVDLTSKHIDERSQYSNQLYSLCTIALDQVKKAQNKLFILHDKHDRLRLDEYHNRKKQQ